MKEPNLANNLSNNNITRTKPPAGNDQSNWQWEGGLGFLATFWRAGKEASVLHFKDVIAQRTILFKGGTYPYVGSLLTMFHYDFRPSNVS